MNQDTRWKQRLQNWNRALAQLDSAFALLAQRELTELEQQGMIQAFEYNYELAWNVIKDFFQNQGVSDIYGSRDAFRTAFNHGLIENGEVWMDMIKKRQLTVHTYNQATSEDILEAIINDYYTAFCQLNEKLNQLAKKA